MIMQVLHPRRTNLLENLSALMIILPLAFCAHKQENWLLLVRSAPSPYPYPGAPYLFCSLSLVSSSKSPNTPHGGSIESRKLASSAPTGGETFYLEMEIHVQYLHLPPPAELVWDCALPNANHLRMCSKSQTEKWRKGYSFKWQWHDTWWWWNERKRCKIFLRWKMNSAAVRSWLTVQDLLGFMQSKTTEPETQ